MENQAIANRFQGRLFDAVLGNGSFTPAFQPIIDLKNGRISSFEVLARWIDPKLGTVNPDQFIPLLEQAGLLSQMTERLMRTACQAASAWQGQFRLAFNIAPAQFVDPNLPTRIATISAETGFPVERIQIEITESAIFDDSDQISRNAALLKSMGIRLLLDDFGTGFSSLTRLQAVPFDKIKIDASFVRSLGVEKGSRKIVSAVIGLGQSLSMPVVAEGIETEQQLAILRQLGCDYGQGYLFSRPIYADIVPVLLRTRGQAAYEPKPIEMSCGRRLAELAALYESDDLAIAFVDTRARFVTISRKFCELTGIDAPSAIDNFVEDVFSHSKRPLAEVIDLTLHTARNTSRTIMVSTKNGIHEFRFNPVRDEDGEVIGASLVLPIYEASMHCEELRDRRAVGQCEVFR